jgi:uncharacterized MAPEG superfamily protein
MTIELEMLTWTAGATILMWMPYIIAHILNVGMMDALSYRADSKPLPDWAGRAKKAHYNAIENLAPFAVLVIVGALAKISNDATAAAAITYFWARMAHYVLYVANVPFARTLTFAIGWLSMLCLCWQILMTLV